MNSFDFGTVRFLRTTGLTDNGSGTHSFPKFFFNGSANTEDAVRSLNVNHDGNFQEKNPDIFVTGFTTNTNEDKDIRTIKYEDPDHE